MIYFNILPGHPPRHQMDHALGGFHSQFYLPSPQGGRPKMSIFRPFAQRAAQCPFEGTSGTDWPRCSPSGIPIPPAAADPGATPRGPSDVFQRVWWAGRGRETVVSHMPRRAPTRATRWSKFRSNRLRDERVAKEKPISRNPH